MPIVTATICIKCVEKSKEIKQNLTAPENNDICFSVFFHLNDQSFCVKERLGTSLCLYLISCMVKYKHKRKHKYKLQYTHIHTRKCGNNIKENDKKEKRAGD